MLQIRHFQPEDIGPVVDLLRRNLPADPITSEDFQRKVLLDINFSPQGAPVACWNDRVVGFALLIHRRFPLEDGPPDVDRSWITLFAVDEDFRKRGIGTALLERVEEYARSCGAEVILISGYAPNYFAPGVDVRAYPEAVEFFKARGFIEVYRPLSMDASLVHLSTPGWVREKEERLRDEGVLFETFRPELILPLLDFMKAEFPGDWQRYIRETMVKITLGKLRPDNVFIAHQNGRVLGFCQHEGERFGPFGTAVAERGRGIGAVLLFRCLQVMRDKGLHNAWFMWTDDEVARLYATAGFTETRRFSYMKKILPARSTLRVVEPG